MRRRRGTGEPQFKRSPIVDLGRVPPNRDIREEDGLAMGTALVHSNAIEGHQIACIHVGHPLMEAEAGPYAEGKGEYYLMIADTEWPVLRERIDAIFAGKE